MNILHRSVHALALVTLLGAAWGSALPAARAADNPPPPSLPAGGGAPSTPPGCTTSHFVSSAPILNLPIPDAVSATVPGVVTSTITVPATGAHIWDVNVTTAVSHSFSSDLVIELKSPSGKTVTLTSNNGSSFANVFAGTTWDDQAGLSFPPGPVTVVQITSNGPKTPLMPEEPLSAFNGENPAGTWSLVVKDTAPILTGTLHYWQLDITALNETPTPVVRQAGPYGLNRDLPDAGTVVTYSLPSVSFLAPLSALTLTTSITDTHPGDLQIDLITPGGVTLTVSNRNGLTDTQAFNGTHWSDRAAPVTDYAFAQGVVSALAPQEAFSEINGLNSNGVWTLRVQDKLPNSSTGTLINTGLIGQVDTCLPQLGLEGNSTPSFPRLGGLEHSGAGINNDGALAHNLALTMTVGGPFAFQSAVNAGWACTGPGVGQTSPVVHCTHTSLPQGVDVSAVMTLSAPLTPMSVPMTLTVSSDRPNVAGGTPLQTIYVAAYAHSANGNAWAVADYLNEPFSSLPDSGQIDQAGQQSLGGFGSLRLVLANLSNTFITETAIDHLGLTYGAGGHWHTMAPQLVETVDVARDIFAPPGADWVRYVDSFTNNGLADRRLVVGWGGQLGTSTGLTTTLTSSGDQTLAANDTFAVFAFRNTTADPSGIPPEGVAFRTPSDTSYLGPYVYGGLPVTTTAWSPLVGTSVGQVFRFDLAHGATRRLAYFVYRGLAEGKSGPEDCDYYGGCVTPAAGTQVTLAQNIVRGLAAAPNFCDLSAPVVASLVNWPSLAEHCIDLPVMVR